MSKTKSDPQPLPPVEADLPEGCRRDMPTDRGFGKAQRAGQKINRLRWEDGPYHQSDDATRLMARGLRHL